jgi:hypothetical protein
MRVMADNTTTDHGVSPLENKWIEIFRAGDYGSKGSYTAADLDHVVQAYNPDFHEAPAVIGHPETNAPAFGWVAGLKRDGSTLFAKLRDVNSAFGDMVKEGLFKKRSASFYRKPTGLELRHIGFLGAQPPDVKGLAAIKFDEGFETAEVVFEEGSMVETQKTVREEIAEFFKSMFGGDAPTAKKNFCEDDAKTLVEAATAPLKAKIAELEGKHTTQATSFAEREKKIAGGELSTRVAEAVNKLRSANKWVPAFEKMGLKVVFGELAKAAETVEFGEGDKKRKISPLDLLVEFMEKLPKIVPGGVKVDGATVVAFSDAAKRHADSRTPVDANSVQLNALAKEMQKAQKISFAEALTQAASEHPELTVPGGATAGAV